MLEMRIVVPDATSASGLAERLSAAFGAERISRFGVSAGSSAFCFCERSDRTVLQIFDAVERWVDQAGVRSQSRCRSASAPIGSPDEPARELATSEQGSARARRRGDARCFERVGRRHRRPQSRGAPGGRSRGASEHGRSADERRTLELLARAQRGLPGLRAERQDRLRRARALLRGRRGWARHPDGVVQNTERVRPRSRGRIGSRKKEAARAADHSPRLRGGASRTSPVSSSPLRLNPFPETKLRLSRLPPTEGDEIGNRQDRGPRDVRDNRTSTPRGTRHGTERQ